MASSIDRTTALKEFDDTKTGVKGLVDSGITYLPAIFHHPNAHLSIPFAPHLSIPTVDLSLPRSIAVDLIRSASRDWGIFQLMNHGIPLSTIQTTISAVRSFHELPAAVRSQYYTRTPVGGFSYYSNLDLFRSAATTCWRDTLKIDLGPVPPELDRIPEVCREALVTWDERVKEVAREVMGMMCEGLGVGPGTLEEMTCLEGRTMVAHYHPPCPEPNRTLGAVDHTDPGALTVLIQDQIGGLQVKSERDDCWVDVKPIPGALVVFAGDFLQIISNDEYKSVEHRVVVNSIDEPRVSIVLFYNPNPRRDESDLYGPLPELLSDKKPARYHNLSMVEFVRVFRKQPVGKKTMLEHFKLP